MKKTLLMLSLILVPTMLFAVPAKRNTWRNITLEDGTVVRAMLNGDETSHYFSTEDGFIYLPTVNNRYVKMTAEQASTRSLSARAMSRRAASQKRRSARMMKAKQEGSFFGEKKALVILVEYPDQKFKAGNDLARYKRIINEVGFNESPFRGSVRDYFRAQSDNQFDLNFDVVGPYTLSQSYTYYGQNDPQYGEDSHPGAMVAEALKLADDDVDFSDYDWDGDGEIEQVYVLYSGKGEADGGASNTIWPHEWELTSSDYGRTVRLDGVTIDTYACGSELNGSNMISGVGTMCHEFSHCMGFPDFYDTSSYGYNYGMGDWDLMSAGIYNGNGYCPAGYTSYERMVCGWKMPTELVNDSTISDMKPLTSGGESFIIYNKAHPDEYVMLENRKFEGWDAQLPAEGMLAIYVDYDETIWQYNYPNAIVQYQGLPANSHERMTIIPANNQKTTYQQYGHPYPYSSNDSLTNTSRPALRLNNANTDGKKLLNVGILKIKKDNQGVISFNFRGSKETIVINDQRPGDAVFFESFDQCAGAGGNDDTWSGATTATATFLPDNEGWESEAMAGANKCAKFGSGTKIGAVTTPTFSIDGETKLSFRVAPWGSDGTNLQLNVNGNATIEPAEFQMEAKKWTVCEATINGDGEISVTITPTKRFFLDAVGAVPTGNPSSIINLNHNTDAVLFDNAIYTLDGRKVANGSWNSVGETLPKGIYIVNGRKVVK